MLYFTILSLLMLLFSFIRKEQKFVLPFFVIILIVLSAFRGESVGTDTVSYRDYFDVIKYGIDLPVEIGWILLNKLVIYFDGSFRSLLFIVSSLTLIPIYFVIKRHSANPMLSLFLYYTLYIYFYSFNISRQTLAVSIVFVAYTFLNIGKREIYLLGVIAASLLHTSALVVLPLFFIDRMPDNKIMYFLGVFITGFIGLFFYDFIFQVLPYLNYSSYLENYDLGNFGGNALYLLVLNSLFIFILLTSTNREVYFKVFYLFILMSNLVVRIPFGNRLIMFFGIIQILYLPYLIYNNKIKQRFILFSVIILYAYVIFFRTFGSGEILPYSNTLF